MARNIATNRYEGHRVGVGIFHASKPYDIDEGSMSKRHSNDSSFWEYWFENIMMIFAPWILELCLSKSSKLCTKKYRRFFVNRKQFFFAYLGPSPVITQLTMPNFWHRRNSDSLMRIANSVSEKNIRCRLKNAHAHVRSGDVLSCLKGGTITRSRISKSTLYELGVDVTSV